MLDGTQHEHGRPYNATRELFSHHEQFVHPKITPMPREFCDLDLGKLGSRVAKGCV
jgi:hypothetical protein